jgi:2-dehydro-3-deoxygluconokinase
MTTIEDTRGARPDLMTVGETMIAFVSRDGAAEYTAIPAGAESNVAVGLARLGFTTSWVSRLGDDPLGDLVESFLRDEGVAVVADREPDHPTGTLVRHVDTTGARTTYYRAGSAASRLSAGDLDAIGPARWLHLTGITPALSPTAYELVDRLVAGEHRADRVSLDVNLRPVLWNSPAEATNVLTRLARSADLVFIGDDEATALLGTADPQAIADAVGLAGDREIVLKQGATGATLLTADETVTVPGLAATVADPTGAGDAFAAGYLAGHLFGWSAVGRLRLGNLLGARVVEVIDDVTPRWSDTELAGLTPEWLASLWEGPNAP